MIAALLAATIILLLVVIALLVLLLRRAGTEAAPLAARLDALERAHERKERGVRLEIAAGRDHSEHHARGLREEIGGSLKGMNDSVLQHLGGMSRTQQLQLDGLVAHLSALTESNERRLDALRGTVEGQLGAIRADNTQQLDRMRQTVDERLQGALEQRLGESFRLVSERLEQVHRGLGEMQTLAHGVGDLKRVLANVKVRGTWGEVQLGNLLEQVLAPEQFATNVAVREASNERVEFAIRLRGQGGKDGEPVWLPIDAKFPQEDYQRLVDAQERADTDAAEAAARQLELRLRASARDICTKYLHPPRTTDFAILFLPTEGLYAEAVRRAGLVDAVQRECRVVLAGPSTLWALLNSLQMGFRTLAIQQQSSEVWAVLGAVKTEFGKFGTVLDKVQKKLQEASNVVEDAGRRRRVVERRLRGVEEMPSVGDAGSSSTTSAPPSPGPVPHEGGRGSTATALTHSIPQSLGANHATPLLYECAAVVFYPIRVTGTSCLVPGGPLPPFPSPRFGPCIAHIFASFCGSRGCRADAGLPPATEVAAETAESRPAPTPPTRAGGLAVVPAAVLTARPGPHRICGQCIANLGEGVASLRTFASTEREARRSGGGSQAHRAPRTQQGGVTGSESAS